MSKARPKRKEPERGWTPIRSKEKPGDRSPCPPVAFKLDKGIKRAVEILQAAGIETYESCEGGPGHSYPEPTVAFHGTPGAGWKALAACLNHGLPVSELRRVWYVLDHTDVTGPYWKMVFRERVY